MKVKIFALVAAFFMLMGGSAWAQSEVKGDVNKDGVVNEQDIAAILAIMAKNNGVAEKTKYYWYVGWTKPTSLDHLKTLATGTHNGNSLGGETSKSSGEKLLTNSPEINNSTNTFYYVVIPSGYNIYDATLPNDPITNDSFSEVTDVTIANHKVYVNNDTSRSVAGLEIY